jgi:hypothetical protein
VCWYVATRRLLTSDRTVCIFNLDKTASVGDDPVHHVKSFRVIDSILQGHNNGHYIPSTSKYMESHHDYGTDGNYRSRTNNNQRPCPMVMMQKAAAGSRQHSSCTSMNKVYY